MSHMLDNPAWFALITGNKDLSIGSDMVRYFPAEISPFAGMRENSAENLERLAAAIPAREMRFVFDDGTLTVPVCWRLHDKVPVLQMAHTGQIPEVSGQYTWRDMGSEDVPEMIALTQLTRPGPFAEKTLRFGYYVGIYMEGRLAAMAGQRLNPTPYAEISAVCTHPDFRKKGLAHALMSYQIRRMRSVSQIPFLHVRAESAETIKLYEMLGFSPRSALYVYILERI